MNFDHKGLEISDVQYLGQGYYYIAFKVTLNNGEVYCLRFRKENGKHFREFDNTSYQIGNLLKEDENTGFLKHFMLKNFSREDKSHVCYIYIPHLTPIKNIKDRIPQVVACLVKALRFIHTNNLFYADFFHH